MGFGTSLAAARGRASLKQLSGQKRAGQERLVQAKQAEKVSLVTEVSGVPRNIFVFGVDNPDDAEGNFYIP